MTKEQAAKQWLITSKCEGGGNWPAPPGEDSEPPSFFSWEVYNLEKAAFIAGMEHREDVRELVKSHKLLLAWVTALKDWSGGTQLDPPIESSIAALKPFEK